MELLAKIMEIAMFVCVHHFIQERIARHVNTLNFKIFISYLKPVLSNNIDTNACSTSPCLNGATCQVSNNGASYTCTCSPGYSGTNCQICNLIFIYFLK
jgi:hypothetical protein